MICPNIIYSLCTGSDERSANVRQQSAGKKPRKTAIHPLTPLSLSQKFFLPSFQDSATLCPPALLLVHQLTSLPGAASRDLLLVCSSSTPRLGLASTRHVESNKVSSTRASPCLISCLIQMLACRRTAFDCCPLWPEWRSAVSLLPVQLMTFSPRTYRHICSAIPCGLASCRHDIPIDQIFQWRLDPHL